MIFAFLLGKYPELLLGQSLMSRIFKMNLDYDPTGTVQKMVSQGLDEKLSDKRTTRLGMKETSVMLGYLTKL